MNENLVRNVFIIGSKSIGQYGGFETFIEKLIEYHKDAKDIKYHIACKANGIGYMNENKLEGVEILYVGKKVSEFIYKNAHIFKFRVPNIGSAASIYYDIISLKYFIKYCRLKKISSPIFYILGCRIGPFISYFKRQIKKLGGKLYINPDGHEWKRSKWSAPVRLYWKESEKLMVKHADLVVCDSVNIKNYIVSNYTWGGGGASFCSLWGRDEEK